MVRNIKIQTRCHNESYIMQNYNIKYYVILHPEAFIRMTYTQQKFKNQECSIWTQLN